MENNHIEQQYRDSKDLCNYLMGKGEISFATYIDNTYKKILVLSAASFFESTISKLISEYANKVSGTDKRIVSLIEQKVVERQYHTLFDWNANNTNAFFKLFGDETKNKVRSQINADDQLKRAEKDFIELGRQRNLLVHKNFAEYDVNITVDEIYSKYKSACNFITYLFSVLDPSFLKN
ncbi:MAG: hypothetical protein LUD78_03785 [Clostridiales bacterium]|nr:hypothetical protein [Clostridiales bacterium]